MRFTLGLSLAASLAIADPAGTVLKRRLGLFLVGFLLVAYAQARAAEAPQVVRDALRSGQSVDVIVEVEASAVEQHADEMAAAANRISLGPSELAYKRAEYAEIKKAALSGIPGVLVLQDFENLTQSLVRIETEAALDALLARPTVKAVHEINKVRPSLAGLVPAVPVLGVALLGASLLFAGARLSPRC